MMMLVNTDQLSHLLQRKCKAKDDDIIRGALLLVKQEAKERQHIMLRVRRNPTQSKANTFNGWFHKTDWTWITVVSFALDCHATMNLTLHILNLTIRLISTSYLGVYAQVFFP